MTRNAKLPVLTGVGEIRTREDQALLTKPGETGGKEEGNPGLRPIPKPNPPRVLSRKLADNT
jgi:hypothetical protein